MEYIAPQPTKEYKVLIKCMTYNQEEYIEDALKGFVRQKTNFPFCALVVDDCSTDSTAEIIKQYELDYPDIIKGIYLPVNMYGNPDKQNYIKPWEERAQYIAVCEGDDYWIDSDKLQKQVDYLIAHPECSYLFTDRYIDDERKGIRQEIRYKKNKYTTHDILSGFIPGVQTVMYKRELMDSPILQTKGINGDRRWAYVASTMGEVHCLHEITAVYRNTGKGVSTSVSQDAFFNHVVNDFMRFHKNLGVNDWMAYLNGQSHKLGTYGPGLTRWKRFCGAYYEYHKIDPRIGLVSYIIMVVLFLKKQLYSRLNIYDPKRYDIKDN